MPTSIIQWFPGHMAKTRRLITENLSEVDMVIELLDARIPQSSKNPEIERLTKDKPKLTLLNKADIADREVSLAWKKRYENAGRACILFDCTKGTGAKELKAAVSEMLSDKLRRYAEKGMTGRRVRAMVLGIPNVGKSSLINRLSGGKSAKAENRPGVTLTKQWVSAPAAGLELLDMPGVLWPKFEDRIVGENLSITGAIKDDVVEIEAVAVALCSRLMARYPRLLQERYKLQGTDLSALEDYEVFRMIGRKRGFLVSGGEIDETRTAKMLLDEFSSMKIGAISLETPPGEETKPC